MSKSLARWIAALLLALTVAPLAHAGIVVPPVVVPLPGVALRSNGAVVTQGPATQDLKPIYSLPTLGTGTFCGATLRVPITPWHDFSRVRVGVGNGTDFLGGVGASSNPVIFYGSMENPSGATSTMAPLAWNGRLQTVEEFGSPLHLSDPIGVYGTAGTPLYLRLGERVSCAPASIAVAATLGGALVSGTTYYYKVTATDLTGGVKMESGAATEQTCAPATVNLACTITITANTATAQRPSYYSVYRSTTTNTEKFLGTTNGLQLTYIDDGSIGTNAAISPPSTLLNSVSEMVTGMTADTGGADKTLNGSGTITSLTGPTQTGIPGPFVVLVDDPSTPSICLEGDSIGLGLGLWGLATTAYLSPGVNGNWFTQAAAAQSVYSLNLGISGSKIGSLVAASNAINSSKLAGLQACDIVLSQLGINDLSGGSSWTAVATWQQQVARQMVSQGRRYYVATLAPSVTWTDNGLAVANQTQSAQEAARVNYNNWIYNGMQFSGATPCNTAACGTPSAYITSSFDLAAPLEVNSSNVLTRNGGYVRVPSASLANYTLNGVPSTSGSLTTLPVSTALTAHTLVGQVVKMTSGARNGEAAIIYDNTTTALQVLITGFTFALNTRQSTGFSGLPANGDTLSTYQPYDLDGLHPNVLGNQVIQSDFQTWLTPNVTAAPF